MRLALAILLSVAVIAAGPVMGGVRAALQSAFPRQYVFVLGAIVITGLAAITVTVLIRIREQRAVRVAAVALALAIGIAYSRATAVPQAEINAVERVHFLEYGLIGLLFYRAWLPSADPSLIVLPVLASVIVGTLDEWLQWFVPVRVGEVRDIALNVVAVVCGVLFGFAFSPPDRWTWRLSDTSRRRLALTAAGTTLLAAAFVSTVHLGRVVVADGIGSFLSHYSPDELDALARDRVDRWRTDPPLVFRRFSREDQYMDEGLWHVRRRNGLWAANDFTRARLENQILERYFQPVLDTSTYALPMGGAWPAEQRAEADMRARPLEAPFFSDAHPYTMVAWPKGTFWAVALICAGGLAATGFLRSSTPADPPIFRR